VTKKYIFLIYLQPEKISIGNLKFLLKRGLKNSIIGFFKTKVSLKKPVSSENSLKLKLERDFKRPWGGFIKFIDNQDCTVKILYLKKGESLSLQYHKLREEFWYVISGKIKLTIGKSLKFLKRKILKERQYNFTHKKFLHRAEAIKDSKILEISFGKFKEGDEIRLKDKYGRKSPK
jgi:mannose-6-phosphate isomerase-like protein (cupin superfamily)